MRTEEMSSLSAEVKFEVLDSKEKEPPRVLVLTNHNSGRRLELTVLLQSKDR